MNNNHVDEKNTVDEGMPDIANDKRQKLKIKAIVLVAILGVFIMGLFGHTHHPEKQRTSEDTFTVDTKAPALNHTTIVKPKAEISDSTAINVNTSLDKEAQKMIMMRMQAPLMVVGGQNQTTVNSSKDTVMSSDPNTQFYQDTSHSQTETTQAVSLKNRSTLIAQGNFIHATLDTAINSDLPGQLRATVSLPVYSEDGAQTLIHPGSRLIGQYKSGLLLGQSRIFVVWTRLIDTEGYSIDLGSPGVDNLGEAGFGGDHIDRHFWQMFGSATLISLIGAGASNVGINSSDPYNASQAYRQAVAQSFTQTANNTLQQSGTIPPTIHKNQGDDIAVFIAKDLRFDHAIQQISNKFNIFNYN